ncbi:lysostaphin resistance A-like protein [Streptococcus tangpeifui]|uniref:CPBP family intramembrane glutamic endopeptidase n=1 Tax=Streptococcus tangpeifui TaxID=2709400 RepID=UPI0037D99C8C
MKPNLFTETAKGKITKSIILLILIALMLLFLGTLIGGLSLVPVTLIYYLEHGFPAPSPSGEIQTSLPFSTDVSTLIELFAFLGIYLTVFGWVKWVEKRPISSMGLFKKDAGRELAKGWLVGAGLFSIIVVLLSLFGMVDLEKINVSAKSLGFLLLYVFAWQIQSGAEELLTRGWLMPAVASHHRKFTAVMVASLLFGLLHLPNAHVTIISLLVVILFGLMMCLYVIWKGNIWGVFGLHAAWNCFQGSVFGIPVSGTAVLPSSIIQLKLKGASYLSGGAFGVEGSILTVFVLSLVCLYLYLKIRKGVVVP